METNSKEIEPKPEVVIELAKPEDAEGIRKVQAETWIATYPNKELGITVDDIRTRVAIDDSIENNKRIEKWREGIEKQNDKNAFFVAKVGDQIVGISIVSIDQDSRGHQGAFYVLPEFQGKGIGMALMNESLKFFGEREVYLEVASYNNRAIEFYRKFGFTENGPVKEENRSATLPGGKHIPEIEMIRKISVNLAKCC